MGLERRFECLACGDCHLNEFNLFIWQGACFLASQSQGLVGLPDLWITLNEFPESRRQLIDINVTHGLVATTIVSQLAYD